MGTTATVLVALAGVAALVDWWSVARERLGVEFIAKPLVVIGLIGAALAVDTGDGVVRGLVVAALGASLVGDVVLMTPDARFEAGVFAFLVAHVLYITAFLETGGLDVGAGVAARHGNGAAGPLLHGRRPLDAVGLAHVNGVAPEEQVLQGRRQGEINGDVGLQQRIGPFIGDQDPGRIQSGLLRRV